MVNKRPSFYYSTIQHILEDFPRWRGNVPIYWDKGVEFRVTTMYLYTMFLKTFLFVLAAMFIFFLLMSTRILLKKKGEFRGTCATNNPMLKNEIGECTVCGAKPEEECKKPEVA